MNSLDLFKAIEEDLKEYYPPNESREFAFIIIEHLFKIRKSHLISNPQINVDENKHLSIQNFIKRLKCNEPIQYIIGETFFLNNKFITTPDVLIPRGETEELVLIIRDLFKNRTDLSILDLCTGSGCIAVSIKKLFPTADVTGVDVSENALSIAQKNAYLNNVDLSWLQLDLLKNEVVFSDIDIVVSNPPYVLNYEKKTIQRNVLDYEPHIALFVPDENPLIFYETITRNFQNSIKREGLIAFEINEQFGKETSMILYKYDFENIEVIKDIHGKDRFVIGRKP